MVEIEKIFNRLDYLELMSAVKNKKIYNIKKMSKDNKYELIAGTHFCDNGVWKDNFFMSLNGMNKVDLSGFGYPYSLEEAMKLKYEDIIDRFCRGFGIEKPTHTQSSFFDNFLTQNCEEELG